MLRRFDDFMRFALYDEAEGYYTRGPLHVGKAGDFFTSVSVGDLFGQLLCRRFLLLWESMGRPSPFLITELGANDGRLASDILDEAERLQPEFSASLRYTLIEPLSRLWEIQKKTTRGRVEIVEKAEQAPRGKGVVFGNELLDAFPVRMAVVREGEWREKYVRSTPRPSEEDLLEWEERPLPPHEGPPVSAAGLPEDYTTEWQDGYPAFFREIAPLLEEGLFLFIDYGRNTADYYAPHRTEGTLRTYYRHERTDNPLLHRGEQDITADVDFTTAARCAKAAGLAPQLFVEQAHWLTSLARPWLLEIEKNPPPPEEFRKLMRQFSTLTHPRQMGCLFHVLELASGPRRPFPLIAPRNWEKELYAE